ncbi:hypothetical protein M3P21_20985 [Ruegeria sp. 2012CJ41-6]|uniref:Uncharacterized protein n=1 Tax=Ruegeria spongiae TaxID=2942209 RepID=A0ABT0QAR5_9RHOB|nr:hypothetical protein [Ruegeria spongiae]MCL6285994.1 hypothetical protein [Ruegeria spongiae]
MKNYIIAGLLCLVLALAIGVRPVQKTVNEALNQGTLKGVETCMSYSKSELLSNDAVQATCVTTFRKRLYHNGHATGRAGPRLGERTVSWGGVLENKTSDHVTTWIQVSVNIFDKDGEETEFLADTPIWIDPLDEAEFRVELPDLESKQLEGLEFCEHEDASPTDCMAWNVSGVMGLAI